MPGPLMESLAARPLLVPAGTLRRVPMRGLAAFTLAFALVAYLGITGGGYDLIVRNEVGIVLWWAVLAGALLGVLPARRLGGWAAAATILLLAVAVWTAVATAAGGSSERGLQEVSRVACYLGVFVLALCLLRDRAEALAWSIRAVATAIVLVAALALLSRLRPGTFAGAVQTAAFLPGTSGRLAWPLNYWNGLAALMAIALPLLLSLSASARTLAGQAFAAAGIPVIALCGYLTFSRGGAIEAGAALATYLLLAGDRLPKLAGGALAAAGSAVLVVAAAHRHAIENGAANAAAVHQGRTLFVVLVIVCAAVALGQMAIGLAARHGNRPRLLAVPAGRRPEAVLVGVLVAVAIALLAGVPGRLTHAWDQFKQPQAVALHQNALGRFGTASGNGRYDYWRVAVHASSGHLLTGTGPGTFQFIWAARGPYWSYVRNAHSLYVETLLEQGVPGLLLLVGFLVLCLSGAVRAAVRGRVAERPGAAAVAAAGVAFAVAAALDWVWQIPVLPIAFLLLMAAVLRPSAPARRAPASARADAASGRTDGPRAWLRGGLIVLAAAALVAIAIPLATAQDLRRSQSAAAAGDLPAALRAAVSAARIEAGAATPQLQVALVRELQGDPAAAVLAARRATADEPANWEAWLVRSRLEAESGHAGAAVRAYAEARSLNPHSPLFAALRSAAR